MTTQRATFEALGRSWGLRLDFSACVRLRGRGGFDLLHVTPSIEKDLQSLVDDCEKFHRAICAILEPSLKGEELALGDALLQGPVYADAVRAFLEAISDFFQTRFQGSKAGVGMEAGLSTAKETLESIYGSTRSEPQAR